MLDAEQDHPGANITGYADAVWWASTTVTTVGYGDRYSVTGAGRAVAVALMVGGIALLGVVTATIASSLVARIAAADEVAQAATQQDVAALAAQVAALRDQLAAVDNAGVPRGSPARLAQPGG